MSCTQGCFSLAASIIKFAYIKAKICRTKRKVIARDHQPCFRTARSKHQARTGHVGGDLGLFDGRWRLNNFCRSIHSRCGCVRKAEPVLELKFPMMILRGKCWKLRIMDDTSNSPDEECQNNNSTKQIIDKKKDRVELRCIGLRLLPFAGNTRSNSHHINPPFQ